MLRFVSATAATVVGALVVYVLFMRPLQHDLAFMAILLFGSAVLSTLIGYLVYRSGWIRRSPRIAWTLLAGYAVVGLLTFLNVWLTARLMFLSPHDVVLAGVLLLFGAGITVSVGYVLSSSLSDEAGRLADAARQVALGQLDVRLQPEGHDEMADLGLAFNDMAEALARAAEQQQTIDALRRDLIAWAGHDLRTPLTSVRVIVEALADGVVEDPDTIQRYLHTARKDIDVLSLLIDDLSFLAQIDAGGLQLDRQPNSLDDLVSDTLESFSLHAERQGTRLRGETAGSLSVISFDARHIGRVLANLIDNALRHTPPEARSVSASGRPKGECPSRCATTARGSTPPTYPTCSTASIAGRGPEAGPPGEPGLDWQSRAASSKLMGGQSPPVALPTGAPASSSCCPRRSAIAAHARGSLGPAQGHHWPRAGLCALPPRSAGRSRPRSQAAILLYSAQGSCKSSVSTQGYSQIMAVRPIAAPTEGGDDVTARVQQTGQSSSRALIRSKETEMRTKRPKRRLLLTLVFLTALLALLALSAGVAQAAPGGGAVYTETNNATANQVLVFHRAPDGQLTAAGAFDTGGKGASFAHPPQGAVVLSQNNRWLFAVNAGSNDVTVFAVKPWGLVRIDREPCSGTMPVSLTVHGNLLYVLEAGGAGSIEGFRISPFGALHPIAGSVRPLSGLATFPEQISFNPQGNLLVVTELDSNRIVTYAINPRGVAGPPMVHDSSGPGPYGFAFTKKGMLLVSEAGDTALSSYKVSSHHFDLVSASVSNGGIGSPCWVAITGNGKYAYTGNGGGGTISSYRVSSKGQLSLLSGMAANTGGAILDLAFSNNSRFLYALDPGNTAIDIFRANPNGSLTAMGSISVPGGADGLAAR